jgi:superoxide dismutase, Cu-Zn family
MDDTGIAISVLWERGGMSAAVRRAGRWAGLPVAIACACLAVVSCGGAEQAAPQGEQQGEQPTATAGEQPGVEEISAEGALAPPDRAQGAFTYDPSLAPEGARLSVEASESDGSTEVRLEVTGLLADRGYAAHVHARPCGPTGAAAGPHYQHEVDPAATPEQPSTDPAFANPRNEIWLDLRTDGSGNAEVTAEVPFVFADRAPASVVIHQAEATATGPGEAGTAGARVACLDVPFEQVPGE